jgi:hypothetical protein
VTVTFASDDEKEEEVNMEELANLIDEAEKNAEKMKDSRVIHMKYCEVSIPKFFNLKDMRSVFQELENLEEEHLASLDPENEKLSIFLHLKLAQIPKDEKYLTYLDHFLFNLVFLKTVRTDIGEIKLPNLDFFYMELSDGFESVQYEKLSSFSIFLKFFQISESKKNQKDYYSSFNPNKKIVNHKKKKGEESESEESEEDSGSESEADSMDSVDLVSEKTVGNRLVLNLVSQFNKD